MLFRRSVIIDNAMEESHPIFNPHPTYKLRQNFDELQSNIYILTGGKSVFIL